MRLSVYILVAAAWLFLVAWVASAEEASVLLERGIYTEETLGDPSAAIPIYEQVLAETQADRQVTAQAHFHLATCAAGCGKRTTKTHHGNRPVTTALYDTCRMLGLVRWDLDS